MYVLFDFIRRWTRVRRVAYLSDSRFRHTRTLLRLYLSQPLGLFLLASMQHLSISLAFSPAKLRFCFYSIDVFAYAFLITIFISLIISIASLHDFCSREFKLIFNLINEFIDVLQSRDNSVTAIAYNDMSGKSKNVMCLHMYMPVYRRKES